MNIIIQHINNGINKKNKPIIIIPKKYVKKANKRNKIRRQIRYILQNYKIKNLIIKYLEFNEKPKFTEINNILNNFLKKLPKKTSILFFLFII